MKKILRLFVRILIIIALFALISNTWIILTTQDQILGESELGEIRRTTLVLGTSYNTVAGEKNPFFYNRINTAARIFHEGHVTEFILSGSATDYYNEPQAMITALAELGVPESTMIVDSLGVRTLSSIQRCKEVFHKQKIIIVTQRFHAYRALFLSNFYELDAVVVATESVDMPVRFGVLMREFFARPLAVIDLYILKRKP